MQHPPPSQPIHRTVSVDEAGCRLDVYLARQPEVGSRARGKSLVTRGWVKLNGVRGKPGAVLQAGHQVEFSVVDEEPQAPAEPVKQPPLDVLHEDAFLLVINKPAGVAVHPPERQRGPELPDIAHAALAHCGELPVIAGEDRPGIVHRLDKDTSGVMLIAKTDESFYFLQSQFKARTVRKEYRAICFGEPRFDSDYVEAKIGVHPRRDRMTIVTEGGKEASTFYEVIERYRGLSYVRCLPKTGRTHQIRVHMASIDHPLVGDKLYHRRRAVDRLPPGAPQPGRHCLHAYHIAILHPRTHEPVEFEATLPSDMERLLRWLRRS